MEAKKLTKTQIRKIAKVVNLGLANYVASTRWRYEAFIPGVEAAINNNTAMDEKWFKAQVDMAGTDKPTISLTAWLALAIQAIRPELVDNENLGIFIGEATSLGYLIPSN